MKKTVSTIGLDIKEKLGLKFFPLGMYYADRRPELAMGFKSKGSGCIMPLIFAGARGNTVAIDKDTTGAAFEIQEGGESKSHMGNA
jgi:hypothetical protein